MEKIEGVNYTITTDKINVSDDTTTYISCTYPKGYSKNDFDNKLDRIKGLAKDLKGIVTVTGYSKVKKEIENGWRDYCIAELEYYKQFNRMTELAQQLQQTGIFYGYWNNPLLQNEIYPLQEEMRKTVLQINKINAQYTNLQRIEDKLMWWDETTTGNIILGKI